MIAIILFPCHNLYLLSANFIVSGWGRGRPGLALGPASACLVRLYAINDSSSIEPVWHQTLAFFGTDTRRSLRGEGTASFEGAECCAPFAVVGVKIILLSMAVDYSVNAVRHLSSSIGAKAPVSPS